MYGAATLSMRIDKCVSINNSKRSLLFHNRDRVRVYHPTHEPNKTVSLYTYEWNERKQKNLASSIQTNKKRARSLARSICVYVSLICQSSFILRSLFTFENKTVFLNACLVYVLCHTIALHVCIAQFVVRLHRSCTQKANIHVWVANVFVAFHSHSSFA